MQARDPSGNELSIGSVVEVACVVTSLRSSNGTAYLSLETLRPTSDHGGPTQIQLTSWQVERVGQLNMEEYRGGSLRGVVTTQSKLTREQATEEECRERATSAPINMKHRHVVYAEGVGVLMGVLVAAEGEPDIAFWSIKDKHLLKPNAVAPTFASERDAAAFVPSYRDLNCRLVLVHPSVEGYRAASEDVEKAGLPGWSDEATAEARHPSPSPKTAPRRRPSRQQPLDFATEFFIRYSYRDAQGNSITSQLSLANEVANACIETGADEEAVFAAVPQGHDEFVRWVAEAIVEKACRKGFEPPQALPIGEVVPTPEPRPFSQRDQALDGLPEWVRRGLLGSMSADEIWAGLEVLHQRAWQQIVEHLGIPDHRLQGDRRRADAVRRLKHALEQSEQKIVDLQMDATQLALAEQSLNEWKRSLKSDEPHASALQSLVRVRELVIAKWDEIEAKVDVMEKRVDEAIKRSSVNQDGGDSMHVMASMFHHVGPIADKPNKNDDTYAPDVLVGYAPHPLIGSHPELVTEPAAEHPIGGNVTQEPLNRAPGIQEQQALPQSWEAEFDQQFVMDFDNIDGVGPKFLFRSYDDMRSIATPEKVKDFIRELVEAPAIAALKEATERVRDIGEQVGRIEGKMKSKASCWLPGGANGGMPQFEDEGRYLIVTKDVPGNGTVPRLYYEVVRANSGSETGSFTLYDSNSNTWEGHEFDVIEWYLPLDGVELPSVETFELTGTQHKLDEVIDHSGLGDGSQGEPLTRGSDKLPQHLGTLRSMISGQRQNIKKLQKEKDELQRKLGESIAIPASGPIYRGDADLPEFIDGLYRRIGKLEQQLAGHPAAEPADSLACNIMRL